MKSRDRILVILNPAARGERARRLADRIEALSPRIRIRLTESQGDAGSMARSAVRHGCRTVVAAGGDGTVNEVVNGIAGTDTAFGILPVGTMNVFATELGIPQGDLKKAWEVIEKSRIREIDLPSANGSHFVQLAGVGLDAEVVKQTTPDSKKTLGPLSYLLTLAQVAASHPPNISIRAEGRRKSEGSFVLIGNGRHYGGPFVLFKNASMEDGLLDVLVFRNQSHWDILRYLQAIAFGAHPELHDVDYFQTRSLSLESDVPVPVELDGELVGTLPFTFGVSPAKLRVLAP